MAASCEAPVASTRRSYTAQWVDRGSLCRGSARDGSGPARRRRPGGLRKGCRRALCRGRPSPRRRWLGKNRHPACREQRFRALGVQIPGRRLRACRLPADDGGPRAWSENAVQRADIESCRGESPLYEPTLTAAERQHHRRNCRCHGKLFRHRFYMARPWRGEVVGGEGLISLHPRCDYPPATGT